MKKVVTRILFVSLMIALMISLTACSSSSQSSSLTNYETVAIENGNLSAHIIANGVVRPNRVQSLTFAIPGKVENVNVNILDTVQEDDILATLEQTSLPQSIILARVDLYQAQKALDDLSASSTSLSQAQLDVITAQDEVNKAARKAKVLSSNSPLGTQDSINIARARFNDAEQTVEFAQKYYDSLGEMSDDSLEKVNALGNLSSAKQARDQAYYNLQYLIGTPTANTVEKAQAELALAESKLAVAQRTVAELEQGIPSSELAAAQARVDAAQSVLDQAMLTAPFDGTITNQSIKSGDTVSAGTLAFQIEDRSQFFVDVKISEIDVNSIHVDQPVTITFDAVVGKEYSGKVSQIGLTGSQEQGAVVYPVVIEITDFDDQIKSGMTAVVRIQTEEVQNVLLVPNKAVRVLEGSRVVFVKSSVGIPAPVKITLGLSSDTMSQVVKGDLKAGDLVVTNPDLLMQLQEQGVSVSTGE